MTHELGYFSPELAAVIGLEEAVIFNKLQWCVENPQMSGTIAYDGLKMIRNPIACTNPRKLNQSHGKQIDWLGNFIWATAGKLRRIFSRLEAIGLVVARKLRAHNWDQCKYYSINYDKLAELLEGAPLSICSKPTNRSGGNDRIDFATADKSYQDTFSDIPLQNLERDGVFDKKEINSQEENQEEEFGFKVELGSPSPVQEVICTPVNREEKFSATQKIDRPDQFSAKVEFASGWDLTELKNFQAKLIQYGAKSGKKNPSGWACTIVKNMTRHGIPSPYWDEFKSGVAIGTCDRREWESEPGVACEAVIRCLEEKFLAKPGTTPAEAAIQIGRVLENPKQMETLWQTIKNRVVFLRDEHRRLADLGVEHAALDPWMTPKPQASSEEAVAALQELQQRQMPSLSPQQSPMPQIEAGDRSEPEPEISEEECRSNLAMFAALCRGEKFEFAKVSAGAGDRNSPPCQGEEEFGDIGW